MRGTSFSHNFKICDTYSQTQDKYFGITKYLLMSTNISGYLIIPSCKSSFRFLGDQNKF